MKPLLAILLILSAFCPPTQAQPAAQPIIGARPAALGQSYIALADDGYAAYWNPAGLSSLRSHQINSMRADIFGTGFIDSYLSYALPFSDRFTGAVDWVNQGFADDELNFGQNRVGFAAGYRILDWLSAGASAKWLRFDAGLEGLGNPDGFSSTGSGWGFDLGLLLTAWSGLRFGLSAQDIGDTQIQYDNGVSRTIYPLNLRLGAAYQLTPQLLLSTGLDEATRLGAEYRLHPALILRGGIHRPLQDAQGTGLAFGIGVRRRFILLDYAYTQAPDLGTTHRFSLGLAFNLSASAVRIQDPEFSPIFPALEKRYSKNPLGHVKLTNTSRKPLAANLSLYIPSAMDAPTEIPDPIVLAPGSETVDLFGLFGPQLTEWSRNRMVPAEIQVSYTEGNRTRRSKKQGQLTIYKRNAMRWDDIGAAASFITPDDPTVAAFASQVLRPAAQSVQQGGRSSRPLLRAMLLFNAISEHGVRYLADPNTPFEQIGGNDFIVDSIQYPAELLEKRSGDCDDCTVLYCSLLENIDISTALIDAPGHILMAFDTGVTADQAEKLGIIEGFYLERNGHLWIPVEVTLFGKSFHTAWRTAAEECVTLERQGRLNIRDTRDAWKIYLPSPPEFDTAVAIPANAAIEPLFAADWQSFRRMRDQFLQTNYLNQLETDPNNSALQNAMVFNLLEFGEYDQALERLDALEIQGTAPTSVANNRAVVYIVSGQMAEAATQLQLVLALDPGDEGAKHNLKIVRTHLGEGFGPTDAGAVEEIDQHLAVGEIKEQGERGEAIELKLEDLHWKPVEKPTPNTQQPTD